MSKRPRTSSMWNYFKICDKNAKIAQCDMCGLKMSFRSTTTNLKTHVTKKHPTVNLDVPRNDLIQVPQTRPVEAVLTISAASTESLSNKPSTSIDNSSSSATTNPPLPRPSQSASTDRAR